MPLDQLPTILKSVASIPALLKEIYGDLAKPGVTQVGKALGTALGLGNTLLYPLALLNEKTRILLVKNLEKYRKQLESVPECDIAKVAPEIGVPISEKLTYVTDDEISDLYVNLLAKASTTPTAHLAHPSFKNVIDNLSPDEALLLKALRNKGDVAFVDLLYIPDTSTGQAATFRELETGIERDITLSFPENMVAYFTNLVGLGILNIRHDIHISDHAVYEELEKLYGFAPLDESSSATEKYQWLWGTIKVTRYGRMFISACTKKLGEA